MVVLPYKSTSINDSSQCGPINIQGIYGGPTVCQAVVWALGDPAVNCDISFPKISCVCVSYSHSKNCWRFGLTTKWSLLSWCDTKAIFHLFQPTFAVGPLQPSSKLDDYPPTFYISLSLEYTPLTPLPLLVCKNTAYPSWLYSNVNPPQN